MNTPSHIIIAIVAGLVNLVLSLIVPCILKQSDEPILQDIKNIYKQNKKTIVVSSIIIVITVYLALSVVDELYASNSYNSSIMDDVTSEIDDLFNLSNLTKLNKRDTMRDFRELFTSDTSITPSLNMLNF